ncbi:hypothetical protein Acid7E03_13450 [Acidisoma sp. 7E03]
MFSKERFFNLQQGDTFYNDLNNFNSYYGKAMERYEGAEWIGDKSPPAYKQYETIERNFDGAHVIFIVRNIIDVAASYQKRAQNANDETWDAQRDYRVAVQDWQESLRRTLAFARLQNRRTKLTILSYEDLFLKLANLSPIFSALDLDVTPTVSADYRGLMARSQELNSQRGDGLTSQQRYHIATTAPFGLYRELLAERLSIASEE